MKIDYLDIALHTVPAILWALASGYAAGFGLAYGGALGAGLLLAGWIAGLGGILFWLVRELSQHGRRLGGLQSQLEWIIPALAQVIAFVVGFAIAW